MSDEIRAWFPFYPADWLLSPTVRGMSLEARGLYLELLCWQWRDGSIPQDVSAICAVTGGSPEVASECLRAFPSVNGRCRKNKRLEGIREEQKSKRAKRVAAGRLGGLKSKQGASNAEASPNQQKESERKKEGVPSAGTNTAQVTYQCEVCKQDVVGFVAFAKHQDTHRGTGV